MANPIYYDRDAMQRYLAEVTANNITPSFVSPGVKGAADRYPDWSIGNYRPANFIVKPNIEKDPVTGEYLSDGDVKLAQLEAAAKEKAVKTGIDAVDEYRKTLLLSTFIDEAVGKVSQENLTSDNQAIDIQARILETAVPGTPAYEHALAKFQVLQNIRAEKKSRLANNPTIAAFIQKKAELDAILPNMQQAARTARIQIVEKEFEDKETQDKLLLKSNIEQRENISPEVFSVVKSMIPPTSAAAKLSDSGIKEEMLKTLNKIPSSISLELIDTATKFAQGTVETDLLSNLAKEDDQVLEYAIEYNMKKIPSDLKDTARQAIGDMLRIRKDLQRGQVLQERINTSPAVEEAKNNLAVAQGKAQTALATEDYLTAVQTVKTQALLETSEKLGRTLLDNNRSQISYPDFAAYGEDSQKANILVSVLKDQEKYPTLDQAILAAAKTLPDPADRELLLTVLNSYIAKTRKQFAPLGIPVTTTPEMLTATLSLSASEAITGILKAAFGLSLE